MSVWESLSGRRAALRKAAVFLARALLGIVLATAIAVANYRAHFNLSTASSLQLLLIVLVTLHWGFSLATVVTLASGLNLNFFFTEPVLRLTVNEPEDWIALITFEATALLVSALSAKVRAHAAQAERERSRNLNLYELSRAILLIDSQRPVDEQLQSILRDSIHVERVDIRMAASADRDEESATGIYNAGVDNDDAEAGISRRVLYQGTRPIGSILLSGWEVNAAMANGVASLVALALERAHSFERQNRAEAGRQTELLRTTVLDGLAHAFKTPLTGIMTASSGLLAIGELTDTQEELISIINKEAVHLNSLTTTLLQTATLEANQVRLHKTSFTLASVLEDVLSKEEETLRSRVRLTLPAEQHAITADERLVMLALTQLIDNAAKYSPVGSLIEIAVQEDGPDMCIVVGNEGPPIPPEERERIFERYYRGAESSHGPPGTGLGLSIVKKAAEAHQGRAWVECEGNSIRFFFTLRDQKGRPHGKA